MSSLTGHDHDGASVTARFVAVETGSAMTSPIVIGVHDHPDRRLGIAGDAAVGGTVTQDAGLGAVPDDADDADGRDTGGTGGLVSPCDLGEGLIA